MDAVKTVMAGLLMVGPSAVPAQQMLHIPVKGAIQSVPVSTGRPSAPSDTAVQISRERRKHGKVYALGPTNDCSDRRAIVQFVVKYPIATCHAWAFRMTTSAGDMTFVDFFIQVEDAPFLSNPLPFGLIDPIEIDLSMIEEGPSFVTGTMHFTPARLGKDSINIITSFEPEGLRGG
ncbi:hypothetical protein LWE61_05285 [Sphingobium sufflavum]|uniref:hypothetical protein n=1 Tax=Sphingobium sufflavum TaxID=1129547 RepID=UPI001F2427F5|nr:hypothetical protein [Sphingobium sufflavum]MCE7795973.1 hypothetical protein [Sphingobium sufflavum]